MVIGRMKKAGITKEEVLRNVDFAFMSEEEQNKAVRKKMEEMKKKVLNFIAEEIKKDIKTEGE